ncbi:GAP family protein [Paenarthrobacter sp. OM7]|uniref:GAP family protein n=1 Tax=Paenarthrobacter sp. AMU7 TaxID=3162492 RepID=A0AB39YNN2_9MICC|nr:GAP family protein [Paenarthrobacter sp. OM7]WGM20432.1 GAP family protein [Paenarthrobacter sp. OM7]
MAELIWELVPVVFGIVASPLAIIALVAVLLSKRPKLNGTMYLFGWILGVSIALSASYAVFGYFELEAQREPPLWVPFARLVLATVLVAGAVWTYRRAHRRTLKMASARSPMEIAEAAPQLPGWLQAVEHFSPGRSFLLGSGIFLLNPVNMSCAIVASLDVRLAEVGSSASMWVLIVFAVISISPMAIPVVLVAVKGRDAEPFLNGVRGWIASHNTTLTVVLLAMVAFMQVQKAIPFLF